MADINPASILRGGGVSSRPVAIPKITGMYCTQHLLGTAVKFCVNFAMPRDVRSIVACADAAELPPRTEQPHAPRPKPSGDGGNSMTACPIYPGLRWSEEERRVGNLRPRTAQYKQRVGARRRKRARRGAGAARVVRGCSAPSARPLPRVPLRHLRPRRRCWLRGPRLLLVGGKPAEHRLRQLHRGRFLLRRRRGLHLDHVVEPR